MILYALYQVAEGSISSPIEGADVTGLCGPLLVGVDYRIDGVLIGIENIREEEIYLSSIELVKPTKLPIGRKTHLVVAHVSLPLYGRAEYHVAWKDLGYPYRSDLVLRIKYDRTHCRIH